MLLRSRMRRLAISALAATVLAGGIVLGGTAAPASAAPSTGIGVGVANLAAANVGRSACGTNSLGGTGFDTSCTGNSGQPESWGADFVAWDWAKENMSTAGLLTSAGGATPATFAKYGGPSGSVHTSPLYNPQPGDAVVYDSPPDYVAIVTAVNADGSIQTTNGDWGGEGPGASSVLNVTIPSGQTAVGSAPDPMNGKTIASYVTPTPAPGLSTSLTPFGAITWTPAGSATARTDVFAADPAGVLWDFPHTVGSAAALGAPTEVESGWTHYREAGIADMNHDGYPDISAIDTDTNDMVIFTGSANGYATTPIVEGNGWTSIFTIYGIADFTHDGHYGYIASRNDSNTLWFYPGDLSGGLDDHIQINSSWTSAYTPVGVADYNGDGNADVLTCRTDLANTPTEIYAGNGKDAANPIGWAGGCANETYFGIVDYNGDGRQDIIARNNATGVLTVMPSSLGSVGTVIATGSATTKALQPFGSYTWTPAGSSSPQIDIYAADANGNLWDYTESPNGMLSTSPKIIETGWTHYREVGIADMNHDGYPDISAIDTTPGTNNGNMDIFTGSSTGYATTPIVEGGGWASVFAMFGIDDYTHDGYQGYVTSRSDSNTLWFYPGDLAGGMADHMDIGSGWTSVFSPVGAADFTGDGHYDVLTCRTDTNSLLVYPGDNTGGAGAIDQLMTGCDNDTFFGVTDYNNDGTPDIIARDNTTGNIIVAPGNGTGGWLNTAASTIATNW